VIDVAGYCPMGCGPTLVLAGQELAGEGEVTCSNPECPRPSFVTQLLQAAVEHEHVVEFDEDGFTVLHPLRERGEDLFRCRINEDLRGLDGPPVEPGRYRATRHEPDAYSESYRSGDCGWSFERIGGGSG
jgi:hypothetical protein